MNRPLPKKAATAIRHLIVDCLKNKRYRIYPDGERYLDLKNLVPKYIIEDLIKEIEQYHIFELPLQPRAKQKYQYVIECKDPTLLIHVKMTPNDEDPPTVFLGFHSHNTGFTPLPQIPTDK